MSESQTLQAPQPDPPDDGRGLPSRTWLDVKGLNAWRGTAHIVQDVSLTLADRRIVIVGRNGMGKSTLCDALAGFLDGSAASRRNGSVVLDGIAIDSIPAHKISRAGLGYVPQGRRVFRSLTTDENLRLAERKDAAWTRDRVYGLFPRLAERRQVPAGVLSGGEQQMLAVGRALVTDPKVLLMDEPSEGLAPAVVDQLVAACLDLEREGVRSLVIEQNLHVACALADDILVLNNGRIAAIVPAADLANDAELQHRYLGVSTAATS